jgi:pimeloyl-ACP methyl ester carboxylesterase
VTVRSVLVRVVPAGEHRGDGSSMMGGTRGHVGKGEGCAVGPLTRDGDALAYTEAGFADDLAWLCDQLRLAKPVVVGHSMGGNVAFELARRYPELPAAVVALDSAIVRPDQVGPVVQRHAAALRGPDWQEAQRRFAEGFFLPTDDARTKARLIDGMAAVPQHVARSAWEQHLLEWDGAAAAAACTVPALFVSAGTPLSDVARFRELAPQLVTGQTVGAGHFIPLLVPEQVNAMLERFLAVSLPAAACACTARRCPGRERCTTGRPLGATSQNSCDRPPGPPDT